MNPDTYVPVLEGEAAKQLAKYRHRIPSKKEIDDMKKADEEYLSHCPDKLANSEPQRKKFHK